MKKLEETELQFRDSEKPNHRGYNHRLEFRPLKITDSRLLAPVLKQNAASIRTYLSTYQHADRWYLKDTQKFVSACVNDDFPRLHFLFLIGNDPVGLASFYEYGDNPREIQVVIAVFGNHQGRGIGKNMAITLKKVAFEVWGFEKLWWLVDASNEASIALAKSIGCVVIRSWKSEAKTAEAESGNWLAMRVDRDRDLPPAVLQGAPIQYWNTPKTPGMLKAVIESGGGTEPIDKTGWTLEEIERYDQENDLNH
jgi:RimJ/RimL family protein N-acetyltransferase